MNITSSETGHPTSPLWILQKDKTTQLKRGTRRTSKPKQVRKKEKEEKREKNKSQKSSSWAGTRAPPDRADFFSFSFFFFLVNSFTRIFFFSLLSQFL